MTNRDSQRFRKTYSYYRPVPRPSDTNLVDKTYVDDALNGLDWKQSVRVASGGNVDLTATHVNVSEIDSGYGAGTLADEDRLLLKDQSTASENGVYIWYSATQKLQRTLDGSQDFLNCGAACYVEEGSLAGKVYILSTNDPITVGSTSITWTQLSGGGGSPGTPLTSVQFNDGGSFGGSSKLVFNKTTGLMTVTAISASYITGTLALVASNSTSSFNASNDLQISATGTIFITASSGLIVSGSRSQLGTEQSSVLFAGDVFHSGGIGTNDYLQLKPVNQLRIPTNTTASYIYTSGSTNDLYFTQYDGQYTNTTRLRWLEGQLVTGLMRGGNISTQAGTTAFSVTSGSGIIVSYNGSFNDEPYPTISTVRWPNFVSASLTYSGSAQSTYVGIDSNGQLVQKSTPWIDGDYYTKIFLGRVLHASGSVASAAAQQPVVAYGNITWNNDFIRSIGPLKISGHTLSASGSTLSLVKSSGMSYAEGRNYSNDPNSPNLVLDTVDTAVTVSKIFREYVSGSTLIQDTGVGNAGYTTIDPTRYNNNGVLTTIPTHNPSEYYTIQRVYWFPNSATRAFVVYYGTKTYTSIADAVAGISDETFVEGSNTASSAILLGYIIVQKDCTDLTNTAKAKIVQAGIMRGTGGGSSAGGTTLPGGSDTYVQFNDGGTTFGGDSGLTFNKTTHTLTASVVVSTQGISGSLTKLSDGTSYLVAGSNITIASSSNGSVIISSTAAGGTSAAQNDNGRASRSRLAESGISSYGGSFPDVFRSDVPNHFMPISGTTFPAITGRSGQLAFVDGVTINTTNKLLRPRMMSAVHDTSAIATWEPGGSFIVDDGSSRVSGYQFTSGGIGLAFARNAYFVGGPTSIAAIEWDNEDTQRTTGNFASGSISTGVMSGRIASLGNYVYATSPSNNDVLFMHASASLMSSASSFVLNVASNTGAGSNPYGIYADNSAGKVWIGLTGSSTVAVYTQGGNGQLTLSGTTAATISNPVSLTSDGSRIFAFSSGSSDVSAINMTSLDVQTFSLNSNTVDDQKFTANSWGHFDGAYLWASCGNVIYKIDPTSTSTIMSSSWSGVIAALVDPSAQSEFTGIQSDRSGAVYTSLNAQWPPNNTLTFVVKVQESDVWASSRVRDSYNNDKISVDDDVVFVPTYATVQIIEGLPVGKRLTFKYASPTGSGSITTGGADQIEVSSTQLASSFTINPEMSAVTFVKSFNNRWRSITNISTGSVAPTNIFTVSGTIEATTNYHVAFTSDGTYTSNHSLPGGMGTTQFYVSSTFGSSVVGIDVNGGEVMPFVDGDVFVSGSVLQPASFVNTSVGSNYNVRSCERYVLLSTLANFTATLPTRALVGTTITFKDMGTANPIMISSSLGDIDGASTYTMPAVAWSKVTLLQWAYPDRWVIVG